MRKPKPLTDEEGEVRELLLEDMKRFRPIREVLSESSLRKLGVEPAEKPAEQPKEEITLPLSRDVLDHFRATGRGWQTRLDAALREWLESHPAG
jgi:uncharacterized protein (DUF4415 family)